MSADLSRVSFEPKRHHTRVVLQQGRPLLDADFNEQVAILLHQLRLRDIDAHGAHWGPGDPKGPGSPPKDWAIDVTYDPAKKLLQIKKGRYYVHGQLCENNDGRSIDAQEDLPGDKAHPTSPPLDKFPGLGVLFYLDVWERLLTAYQASRGPGPDKQDPVDPMAQDPAFGHIESTARYRLVWQVKFIEKPTSSADPLFALFDTLAGAPSKQEEYDAFLKIIAGRESSPPGQLQVRAKVAGDATTERDCPTEPASGYRGLENQFYRVEIHEGGAYDKASFKWSRDNASFVYPVVDFGKPGKGASGRVEQTVYLADLGRDVAAELPRGTWVELVNDFTELRGRENGDLVPTLLKVLAVDDADGSVSLEMPESVALEVTAARHPMLRRWDQPGHDAPADAAAGLLSPKNAILIARASANAKDKEGWITLEDGVQVKFDDKGTYRTGDAWRFAARYATGDVEWPRDDKSKPELRPPHEPVHWFAPLRLFLPAAPATPPKDLRVLILPTGGVVGPDMAGQG